MLKIYLAARYVRHEEMLKYAQDLDAKGFGITSRWIYGSHEHGESFSENQRFAMEDWEDLLNADIVISFTEGNKEYSRGGRHVEFGVARATAKHCIIVGPRENVFHYLPSIEHYDDWETCLSYLEVSFVN